MHRNYGLKFLKVKTSKKEQQKKKKEKRCN